MADRTEPGERVAGIVLARYDSKRLPMKVLADLGGRPLLGLLTDRIRSVSNLDRIVIATTERPVDDPIVEFAERSDVKVHRGPLRDVAKRMIEAGRSVAAPLLVRLNADSPFPDRTLLEEAIAIARVGGYDLVTNLMPRTYPYGISAEVLRLTALEAAYPHMSVVDREHVTRFFYRYPDRFAIEPIRAPERMNTDARLVVDTEEDLDRARAVVEALGSSVDAAPYQDIVRTYERIADGAQEST